MRTFCRLAIPVVLLFGHSTAFGQHGCYNQSRTEGIRLREQGEYDEAINVFFAAFVDCTDKPMDDDLIVQIQRTQQIWVKDLERAVAKEKAAYEQAERAKQQALVAREAETVAKLEAERNAQKAKEQGVRAESMRLALLADLTRQTGSKQDALLLSWLALQAPGNDTVAFVLKAFADAVRDSFQTELFTTDQPVRVMRPVEGTPLILTEQADGQIVLLNPQTDQQIDGVETNALGVAAAPDAQRWASWTTDGKTVLIRNESTKQSVGAGGHAEPVRFAVFSPDGRHTITCSRDNTARLWRADGELVGVLAGHSGNIYHADFAPNGESLFTRSTDGRVMIWNTDGRLVGRAGSDEDYFYDAVFLMQGAFLATLNATGRVDIWQKNGTLRKTLETDSPVRTMRASQSGDNLSFLSAGGKVYVYSTPDNFMYVVCEQNVPAIGYAYVEPIGHLITWDNEHHLSLWDHRGNMLQRWKAHNMRIAWVESSPDGALLLSTGLDGLARLWDTSGRLVMELPTGADETLPARFTADGRHIIFAQKGNTQLSLVPIPTEKLAEWNALAHQNTAAIRTLAAQHNLQFVDEMIAQHK